MNASNTKKKRISAKTEIRNKDLVIAYNELLKEEGEKAQYLSKMYFCRKLELRFYVGSTCISKILNKEMKRKTHER